MLLTVKKQVEETVELKTPAYYKDTMLGNLHYINPNGEITTVRKRMVNMWCPDDGKAYTDEINDIMQRGEPVTKEEFDTAYAEVMSKFEKAVTVHA